MERLSANGDDALARFVTDTGQFADRTNGHRSQEPDEAELNEREPALA
jgi:hypothetical protein